MAALAWLDGVVGQCLTATNTDVVVPAGSKGPVPLDQASRTPLLAYESLFAAFPLSMASYPAIALRLQKADPDLLRESLAAALAEQGGLLAGRLVDGGRAVALTDDGVPFTVARRPEPSAPQQIPEPDLLHLADFRRPGRVVAGLDPVMTVKLTCFRDGSAVLCLCRTHGVLDGSSAWAFLDEWSRHARGEASASSRQGAARRPALHNLLPEKNRLDEMATELLGRPLGSSLLTTAIKTSLSTFGAASDPLFLAGMTGDLSRPRVFLSHAEVARIKAAATPPSGAGAKWVSTQEALTAYILLTIGRATLPACSLGRAMVTFILDARRACGLQENALCGAGVILRRCSMRGLLSMTLSQVASELHEQSQAAQVADGKMWQLIAGAAETGVELDVLQTQVNPLDYDICLVINNQSKRRLPDFGPEAGGGRAQAALTNSGPVLLFPAEGGVDVFLHWSLLRTAGSASAAAAAVAALRDELPPPRPPASPLPQFAAPGGGRAALGGA
mmetsp:Transcript_103607/g.259826  ORF Transcript_103607/g.259826 Transcript_103607/m.259826 type:complete len:503 (+) Transcript_103607:360-1868(+)